MKFILNINQQRIVQLGYSLDVTEAVVLDVLCFYLNSKRCEIIQQDSKTYFWIKYSLIRSQIPLVFKEFKDDSIYRFLKKLEKNGFIEFNTQLSKTENKTYLHLTKKTILLYSDEPSDTKTSIKTDTRMNHPMGKDIPSDETTDGPYELSSDVYSIYSDTVKEYYLFYPNFNILLKTHTCASACEDENLRGRIKIVPGKHVEIMLHDGITFEILDLDRMKKATHEQFSAYRSDILKFRTHPYLSGYVELVDKLFSEKAMEASQEMSSMQTKK